MLILGDLNSYAHEDPITTLEGAGYTNLIAARNGREAYSYVFDGHWGYLDHALGPARGFIENPRAGDRGGRLAHQRRRACSARLQHGVQNPDQLTSLYAPDEFRVSDHDRVVVGLSLTNASPIVRAVEVVPSPMSVGVPVTAKADFADADRLDTHTAVIDWGDGTTSSGTVTEGSGASTDGSLTGSHAYTAAGFYTVTVADGFGHAVSNTSRQVVVYDRAAGQVVEAGSIFSPKGAWVAQPLVSGRARLSFAVGYRGTSQQPVGVFGYVLAGPPRSRLVVSATSFDYLVVTGDTARFAGGASLNGAAGFRYEVTVTDGRRADTACIVVRGPGGALVYDSKRQRVGGAVAIRP